MNKILVWSASFVWDWLVSPLAEISLCLGRFGRAVCTAEVAEMFSCDAEATSRQWTVQQLRSLYRLAHTGSSCHTQQRPGAPE